VRRCAPQSPDDFAEDAVWFASWYSTLQGVIRAAVSYLVIVGSLRVLGEQVLAKMSAYDMIVTITLGSVVANIPFSHEVAVVDGLAIMVTFVMLQETIRWAQSRSKMARKIVAERPRVVVWDGRLLVERVQQWRLTIEEIRAAVRRAGVASISDVQAVVLENDGDWSVVLRRDCGPDRSAFEGLDVPGPRAG
jgi:uncharacterized membrane protein YcaP (DUF421 family)